MAALYVHIPFCEHKCVYCDFYSIAPSEEKMDERSMKDVFTARLLREITLRAPSVIGPAGMCIRGHEFHYSGIDPASEPGDVETVFSVSARAGVRREPTGYVTETNRVLRLIRSRLQ